MKNLFDAHDTAATIERLNRLTPSSQPQWGKMTVGQMLAHCNVAYEMVYTDKHARPNPLMRFMLKMLAKDTVVGSKPYKKNGPTAPAFRMTEDRDFAAEKQRLIDHLHQTQQLGAAHFDGKESHSFGPLSKDEWNTLFSKHLDHHLTQFGV